MKTETEIVIQMSTEMWYVTTVMFISEKDSDGAVQCFMELDNL